jgi:hypothetical protein
MAKKTAKKTEPITDFDEQLRKEREAEEKAFNTLPITQAEADAIKEVMTAARTFAKVLKENKCCLVALDHGWPYHHLHICPKRLDPRRTDAAADVYPDEEKYPRHSLYTLPMAKMFGIVEMYDEGGDYELVERKRIKEVAKVLKSTEDKD